MSKSQLNQDINVIEFFNKGKGLYFIDIGANDGISLSNTYLLEKEYNWDGICCEPMVNAFNKLKKCRNVTLVDKAVFSKSNLKLEFSNSNMLSGITSFIDKHKTALDGKKTIVATITLQDLLKTYNSPHIIHYMSLDTEGTELEILKSVNYSDYTFLYINLEHNYIEPRRTEMRKLLTDNGYIYKGENKWDDDYIHKSALEGTYYHNNMYNKPILIQVDNNNKIKVSSSYWSDDSGIFDPKTLQLKWTQLGIGKLYYDHIDYGEGNIWHRDRR